MSEMNGNLAVAELNERVVGDVRIEAGIPIPTPPTRKGNGKWEAVMRSLQVGESFEASSGQTSNVYKLKKLVGIECAIRRNGNKIRVWRTK